MEGDERLAAQLQAEENAIDVAQLLSSGLNNPRIQEVVAVGNNELHRDSPSVERGGRDLSRGAHPDTAGDAVLAAILQDAHDEENVEAVVRALSTDVVDTPSACIVSDEDEGSSVAVVNSERGNSVIGRFLGETNGGDVGGDSWPQSNAKRQSKVSRQESAYKRCRSEVGASLRVKVFITDRKAIVVRVGREELLSSLFMKQVIVQEIRMEYEGYRGADDNAIAKAIILHCGIPHSATYDRTLADSTTVVEALGGSEGIVRVNLKRKVVSSKAPRGCSDPHCSEAIARVPSGGSVPAGVLLGRAYCHAVKVLRLRDPRSGIGSPILQVKNFNCDRGLLLAGLTRLRPMVEGAPEAQRELTNNVRSELQAYPQGEIASRKVQSASDRVLNICENAIQHDHQAKEALSRRTAYTSTAVLIYDKNAKLPRHSDNCGNWVVLFSFGNTVDFFCGEQAVPFESGDALVFNGSKEHAVVHGIDSFWKNATVNDGTKRKLPKDMMFLRNLRVSFQSRQCDA
eukprot:TRINITY_DN77931_c0_g1_i1.p1 TRINITY_DN77931_c0_g1~~TRINITY_DN77931_c0_g1_i1.p1  ORF type:complete len:571 (-),score=72.96 TRINITY_DN77931_c0_g1_i1:52-1593(-)